MSDLNKGKMMSDKFDTFAKVYNDIGQYSNLRQVADKLKISVKTVKNTAGKIRAAGELKLVSRKQEKLRRDAETGKMGFEPVLPGYMMSKSSVTYDRDGNVRSSSVQQKKAPGETFVLPDHFAVNEMSVLKDSDGRVLMQWDKIKRERREEMIELAQAIRKAFEDLRGTSTLVPAPEHPLENILTVYPLADLHLNMRSWEAETKDPYDLRIAESRFKTTMNNLIEQSLPTDEGLFLSLGDLFHMNDHKNVTPISGHRLDSDGSYGQMLRVGVRLIMWVIERLKIRHRIVRCRFLPGNHDPDATEALTVALALFYENDPRVIVVDDPSPHFFYRFGKVLLGATHGHTMTPEKMAMMLPVDCPVDWGLSIFRHIFFGHIHHKKVVEICGVLVESFNTIASKDGYAHGGGYRSDKVLTSIRFHRDLGQIGRNYEPVLLTHFVE
jgi:hypothetical protein